jgi:ABC-type antimicrobial peptide transport system permease subunit
VAVRCALGATRPQFGAQPSGILRLVVEQGALLTAIALAIGAAGAFALTRFLSTLLFGVGTYDPLTFGTVTLVMSAVALTATAIPAWSAARTDPAMALRAE